jgi:superfamily II DNA or RNA helicase
MVKKLYIAEWAYTRLNDLSMTEINRIYDRLTVTPRILEPTQEPDPILNYYLHKEGWLGMPIDWALDNFPDAELIDKTKEGEEIVFDCTLPDPYHERASKGQAEFIEDIVRKCEGNFTILAMAPTGSGKTVSSLSAAVTLGRKTMIVAPTQVLASQWINAIKEHLNVPEERIGFVQQDICDYEDKDFVVGIINSLAKRDYGRDFYTSFGTVIWDEVHVTGARMFRKTLSKFPSQYRIALTATPTRRDGCDKIFLDYFGKPSVVANAKALEAEVRVIRYPSPIKSQEVPHAILLNMLAKDKERNLLILEFIVRLLDVRDNVLVIGDRIGHLEELIGMCELRGVPKSIIGQFTASHTDFATVSKGKKPKRVQTSDKELERIKKESRLIFATYGMMKQGVDIPRLDAGIDVTPRSEGIQVLGRIRRPLPNKKKPLWITIEDVGVGKLQGMTRARIRDYKKTNTNIVYYAEKENKE